MRLRHIAGLATAASVVLGLQVPTSALADASTIYVDGSTSTNCSYSAGETGTGTQQHPFCYIQSAADVVQPGQTVQVAPGSYQQGGVTVTHSGTPDKPITFRGSSIRDGSVAMARLYTAPRTGTRSKWAFRELCSVMRLSSLTAS